MFISFEHLDGSVVKLSVDDDRTADTVAEDKANAIRSAARGSHVFGHGDGFHLLKFVLANEMLERPKPFTASARDDSRGGRILLRSTVDLEAFIRIMYPMVTQVGTVSLTAFCAPLAGHSILAVPSEVARIQNSAKVLAKLGISRLVEIRLSDGKGKGKSPPRASEQKIAYLVPGIPQNARKPGPSRRSLESMSSTSSLSSFLLPHDVNPYDTLTARVARARYVDSETKSKTLELLGTFRDLGIIEELQCICELPEDASVVALTSQDFARAMVVHCLKDDPESLDMVLSKLYQ